MVRVSSLMCMKGVITLLAIYDKAERESLPAARIAELLALAKERAGVADE